MKKRKSVGIDRVEFYIDGAKSKSVRARKTRNPLMGTWAYVANVPIPKDAEDPIELRGTVYPAKGHPKRLAGRVKRRTR